MENVEKSNTFTCHLWVLFKRISQQDFTRISIVEGVTYREHMQRRIPCMDKVFPTCLQLCTNIVVMFWTFQQNIFQFTSKRWPKLSSAACPLFSKSQTIYQPQRSTKTFISAKKSLNFRIIIEILSYRLISLRDNIIYNIFILDRSYEDHIRNVINPVLSLSDHIYFFNRKWINISN